MFSAYIIFPYLLGIALLIDGIVYAVSSKFRKKIKEDKQIRTLRLFVSIICVFVFLYYCFGFNTLSYS
jgi:uncharacterized membrane protein HdeD (DUF308 family)